MENSSVWGDCISGTVSPSVKLGIAKAKANNVYKGRKPSINVELDFSKPVSPRIMH